MKDLKLYAYGKGDEIGKMLSEILCGEDCLNGFAQKYFEYGNKK